MLTTNRCSSADGEDKIYIITESNFYRNRILRHKEQKNLIQHYLGKRYRLQDILTAHDTRYILYGEGQEDIVLDEKLHQYIRSMTSRQTPGEPRLAGHPGRQHYSQMGASEFVDKFLNRRRNGIFLECGASDGETISNSLFFELYRNWTGILIEANPNRIKSLIEKNRNAHVVRACLSVTGKPDVVKFASGPGIGGGLKSSIDRDVIEAFKMHAHVSVLPEIYVQCFPLMSILTALNIFHNDYLSLDVEGAEIDILKTVDWTRLTVDILTVEYRSNMQNLGKLKAVFNKTGRYRMAGVLPVGERQKRALDAIFIRI